MIELTAKTKLLCVIGSPVSHSLSPSIQNRLIMDAGLNGEYAYAALKVESGDAGLFLKSMKRFGIAGCNVTMPLKAEVIPHLDEIDGEAKRYGAVNTVVNRAGALYGYNTDGTGFIDSLKLCGVDIDGHALILGAGRAATTAALALIKKGVSVCVCSRKPPDFQAPEISVVPWGEVLEYAANAQLLVNATPLGMLGCPADFEDFGFVGALPKDAVVYDMIYAPKETGLLRCAKSRGLKTINGLPMLVCQAAASFCHFTGKTVENPKLTGILSEFEGEGI